jgi:D-alanyl-D-alanine dipeptidase
MVGRTLRAGVRVRELLGETPLGQHYRAEYPNGVDVSVLIVGSSAELPFRPSGLQPGNIQHRNIAAIHALNETDDGLVYAVAEPLTGEFLSVTLTRRGALPLREALDLCLQAAAGLQAAHDVGWVHGSLSPNTILLARAEGRPLVKLIGFAYQFPLRKSQAESPIDGAVYASPERIAGHRAHERSDVFSLGAVLHHLLTGAPPTPGSRTTRGPKAIRAVLNRALAPSPSERFQTVTEFTGALAPLLTEAPLTDPAQITLRHVYPEEAAASKEDLKFLLLPPGPARPDRRRRFAFGAAAVLVAVVAGLWLRGGIQWPLGGVAARAGSQEHRSTRVIESASASAPAHTPGDAGSLRTVPRDSAAAEILTDPVIRPSTNRARYDSASATAESPLVDVQSVDSTIQVDLRYATAKNFTGAPLPGYEAQRALLLLEVATALGRVQARLRRDRVGLRIFDAYRPVRATRAMATWAQRTGRRELFKSGFIGERSQHNLGVAVDVTLVDLERGTEVSDPDILYRTMRSEGFSTVHQASYHFVYELDGAMPLDHVIR